MSKWVSPVLCQQWYERTSLHKKSLISSLMNMRCIYTVSHSIWLAYCVTVYSPSVYEWVMVDVVCLCFKRMFCCRLQWVSLPFKLWLFVYIPLKESLPPCVRKYFLSTYSPGTVLWGKWNTLLPSHWLRCVTSTDTFTVEDAVEAIGFGRFQWKLSMLTGVSWVRDR